MQKYLLILGLFFYGNAKAQNCLGNFLGTKTLYTVQQHTYTPAPKGYEAVFINHVGRHGARHLTKDVASSYAFQLLKKADSLHVLTDAGKKLWQMVSKIQMVEKNDFESISAQGKLEQQGLAKRMLANYPTVFSGTDVSINVTVAKKLRTSQSADAFLTGLKEKMSTESIKKTVNDTILRFYDLSPAYESFKENGNWKKAFEEFKKSQQMASLAAKFSKGFFDPAFFSGLSEEQLEKLMDDVYGFATVTGSIQTEISNAGYEPEEVNFSPLFTCNELAVLNRVADAEDFLVKGPGTDVSGIQVKIAAPLLANFIGTTDAFIANGKPSVQLRFSHAETIAPFAALLGIKGASKPVKKGNEIATVWRSAEIIPLSANIQWVLYKNQRSNKYLVKFLLNEKEVAIDGLSTTTFPYYNWKTVRNFYSNKLQKLNTSVADNGYRFLRNVN